MITITPRAHAELSGILALQVGPGPAVRVDAIRGSHGCVHGWRLGIAETERPEDVVVRDGDLRVLIDADLRELLEGARLDYHEDEFAIGFVIDAPAAGHGHERGRCAH
jgi:Fe-S cluster assembly iron-binding protein IscA